MVAEGILPASYTNSESNKYEPSTYNRDEVGFRSSPDNEYENEEADAALIKSSRPDTGIAVSALEYP